MTRPAISFEFFPPKNIEASFRLAECVAELAPLAPDFVSVTYGAGGTTRQLTHEAVTAIHKTRGLRVAAHLTCVSATREETLAIADSYAETGVTDIVALRGDPPKGQGKFTQAPGGFAGSVDLVEALAATGKFTLRVGAYPERHPDAADHSQDIAHLKRKIDAGASAAITQFFFSPDVYFRFRDDCVKAGITAPIIPGILPIANWAGAQRIAAACGASFPAEMVAAFDAAQAKGDITEVATGQATALSQALLDGGVDALHFYTLNRPELTRAVCGALGIGAPLGKVA